MKVSYTAVHHNQRADYTPVVIIDGDKKQYSHQFIDLSEHGEAIIDEKVAYDAPWLSLQRGDGFIYFTFSNQDHSNIGSKMLAGTITLYNGAFTGFEQDPRDGMGVEKQGDGIFDLGNGGQDEVLYREGSVSAQFVLTVTGSSDGFYLYYKPYEACKSPVVVVPTPEPPFKEKPTPIYPPIVIGLPFPIDPPSGLPVDHSSSSTETSEGRPSSGPGLPVSVGSPVRPLPVISIPEPIVPVPIVKPVVAQPVFIPEPVRPAAPEVIAEELEMICFTIDGLITHDRSACAPNAPKHQEMIEEVMGTRTVTLHNISAEEEEVIAVRMNQRFIGQQIIDDKRENLLAVLSSAREKIQTIGASIALSNDGMVFMNQSKEWVDNRFAELSEGRQSLENMNAMSDATKELLERTKKVVFTSRIAAPDTGVSIDSVTVRVGEVLMKIYQALLVMSRENIAVDQTIIDHYQNAMDIYNDIKDACPANTEKCKRLGNVIAEIELMKDPLEATMESISDPIVSKEINIILEGE